MSALGLAIMIVAGVVTLDVILENTNNTDASVVGQTISNVDLGGFFTAGVLVGVALMLGVMLLLAGLRRANRKRQERKELERSYAGTATQAESLQEERDRLAAELEQERRAREQAERRGETVPVGAVGHPAAVGNSPAVGAPATAGAPASPGAYTESGDTGLRSHDTHEMPARTDVPVYPTGTQGTGEPATAAGTTTERRTEQKPSLKQRLLGS